MAGSYVLLYKVTVRNVKPGKNPYETVLGTAHGEQVEIRRHEVFPYLPPPLPYVVLHYGVLALKAVLVPPPLKDALGRVALLLGDSQVIFIIWPMTPVKASSLGLRGGLCLR